MDKSGCGVYTKAVWPPSSATLTTSCKGEVWFGARITGNGLPGLRCVWRGSGDGLVCPYKQCLYSDHNHIPWRLLISNSTDFRSIFSLSCFSHVGSCIIIMTSLVTRLAHYKFFNSQKMVVVGLKYLPWQPIMISQLKLCMHVVDYLLILRGVLPAILLQ